MAFCERKERPSTSSNRDPSNLIEAPPEKCTEQGKIADSTEISKRSEIAIPLSIDDSGRPVVTFHNGQTKKIPSGTWSLKGSLAMLGTSEKSYRIESDSASKDIQGSLWRDGRNASPFWPRCCLR